MKQCRRLLEDDLSIDPKSLDQCRDLVTKEVDRVRPTTLWHPASSQSDFTVPCAVIMAVSEFSPTLNR